LGNARDIIPTLNITFDLIFIDADKENYSRYFDLVIDKLNFGGIILTDNVLWDGKVLEKAEDKDSDTLSISRYNQKIINDKRVETVLIPFRDGISISRKIQ
jgi:caffeoyl-CoA O-methyltransferase